MASGVMNASSASASALLQAAQNWRTTSIGSALIKTLQSTLPPGASCHQAIGLGEVAALGESSGSLLLPLTAPNSCRVAATPARRLSQNVAKSSSAGCPRSP